MSLSLLTAKIKTAKEEFTRERIGVEDVLGIRKLDYAWQFLTIGKTWHVLPIDTLCPYYTPETNQQCDTSNFDKMIRLKSKNYHLSILDQPLRLSGNLYTKERTLFQQEKDFFITTTMTSFIWQIFRLKSLIVYPPNLAPCDFQLRLNLKTFLTRKNSRQGTKITLPNNNKLIN